MNVVVDTFISFRIGFRIDLFMNSQNLIKFVILLGSNDDVFVYTGKKQKFKLKIWLLDGGGQLQLKIDRPVLARMF